MSGIYIHIPFCVEKCSYCNFYSSTEISQKEHFIHALFKEMELRKDYLNAIVPETLYFGGGTPSILSPKEIEMIISQVKRVFGLKSDAEITLEANPNNLNEEYFKGLKDTSINRLSIGIQSFFDDNLKMLGRVHTAKQAETSLELADKYRFFNLSVDLMYGYPQLSMEQWQSNLRKVKEIPHLSCYSLSLETNAALYRKIQNNSLQLPDEEHLMEQYQTLEKFAKDHDFIHYETSNFCKTGQFSVHNTAYWQDKSYIGLGAAAHSFNRTHRSWNVANVEEYIKQIMAVKTTEEWQSKGENNVFEQEELTLIMRINEYLMTSLRTIWGCDLNYISDEFGDSFLYRLKQKLKVINSQYYHLHNNTIILTQAGSLLADAIAGELFLEECELAW